ncbi:MAG: hypothetical protein ACFE9L_12380 [Candidatus Hodarchaeota archaeon]
MKAKELREASTNDIMAVITNNIKELESVKQYFDSEFLKKMIKKRTIQKPTFG